MRQTAQAVAVLSCCWLISLVGCGNEQAAAPQVKQPPTVKATPSPEVASRPKPEVAKPVSVAPSSQDVPSPADQTKPVASNTPTPAETKAPQEPDKAAPETKTETITKTVKDEPLPGPITPPSLPASLSPEEVITIFLDSIRKGDKDTIANLLTNVAREETTKQGLVIRPPGSPDAKYEVAKAQYPADQADGAWVNTIWTMKTPNGEKAETEAVWALRREQDGWRIVGVGAQIRANEPSQFFNFEQPKELYNQLQQKPAEVANENRPEASSRKDEQKSPTQTGKTMLR